MGFETHASFKKTSDFKSGTLDRSVIRLLADLRASIAQCGAKSVGRTGIEPVPPEYESSGLTHYPISSTNQTGRPDSKLTLLGHDPNELPLLHRPVSGESFSRLILVQTSLYCL